MAADSPELAKAPTKQQHATTGLQLNSQVPSEKPKAGRASPKKKRKADLPPEERRRKRYRDKDPQSYLAVKERAETQRLTVLSRERYGDDAVPGEKVTIAGSTGNVYTVTIGELPSCDCPHATKGNQCKHILYVMLRVLKAHNDTARQLALTHIELRQIMKNAPPIPGVETDGKDGSEKPGEDSNRKPICGECPICYDDLDEKEAIVYCKTSCGNNIHKACMDIWLNTNHTKATCPYCRAIWSEDLLLAGRISTVDTTGLQRNGDGYLNVASQLGISQERDMSTYHPFWVRRNFPDRYDFEGLD